MQKILAVEGRRMWMNWSQLALFLCVFPSWLGNSETDLFKLSARPGPDWLASAVVYEVFPRVFSKEGNLAGVTRHLEDLKDLGVDIVWLMPIHPTGEKNKKPGPEGSPYAVKDYYKVNPRLGTNGDLVALVNKAHALGMKVIVDLVANHTAWDAAWINDSDCYRKNKKGEVISPQPDWHDVAALEYNIPKTRKAMIAVMKYWLEQANLDGFRCDAASFVPLSFWEEARAALEVRHPGLLLLAEAEDPPFMLKAFDLDYGWSLYHSLNRVMLEGKPATDLRTTWEASRRQFPQGSRHLRFSDNHDQIRAVSRYGIDGAIAAQIFMFAIDGIPLVYNGMEVGDAAESAAPALFGSRKIEWEPVGRGQIRDLYKEVIAFRKKEGAFTSGDVIWLGNSQSQDVVSFLRKNGEKGYLVVINLSSRPRDVSIKVPWGKDWSMVHFFKNPKKVVGTPESLQMSGYGWTIFLSK